jgi:hypothetical protein
MQKIIEKECKKHGLSVFVFELGSKRYRCKKCRAQSVMNTRRNAKKRLLEVFGNKCCICGYFKCLGALEFHHVDSMTKNFSISSSKANTRSLKVKMKEAQKCLVLCANCHREVESGLILKEVLVEKLQLRVLDELKFSELGSNTKVPNLQTDTNS